MVRMSDNEYLTLKKAKNELLKLGINNLNLPNNKICSKCGEEMHGFAIEFHHSICPKCGNQETGFWITAAGGFALGALATIGIGALLYYLFKDKSK